MSEEQGTVDSRFFSFAGPFNYFEKSSYRCLDCLDLPFITIDAKNFLVCSECRNKHIHKNIPTDSFYPKLKEVSCTKTCKDLHIISCFKCKKKLLPPELEGKKEITDEEYQRVLENFSFCNECKKHICGECAKTHKGTSHNHHKISLDKLYSNCILHGEKFSAYCTECKVNTCVMCVEKHKKHKKIHLDELLPFEEEIQTKKRILLDLKNYYETLANNVVEILNNVRKQLLEDIQKKMNLVMLDELLLDSYETNKFNYQYTQNVMNNLNDLQSQSELKNAKDLLYDIIKNYQITGTVMNEDINKMTQKNLEMFNVTQTMRATTKKSLKEAMKEEEEEEYKVENNIEQGTNMKEDIMKTTMKEETLKSIKNETLKKSTVKNETQKSLKESVKKSTVKNDTKNETKKSIKDETLKSNNDYLLKQSKKSIKNDTIRSNANDLLRDTNRIEQTQVKQSFHSEYDFEMTKQKEVLQCEFIGKNEIMAEFNLSTLPGTIEIPIEIRNTGNTKIPSGTYFMDEMNCGQIMPTETAIPEIEPGKSVFKQFQFETYIYKADNFQLKLIIKDPFGNIISTNSFSYRLKVN